MSKKIYNPGDLIGTHQLTVVREVEPKNSRRQFEVICPNCNQNFITNLNNLNRKINSTKNPVKQCSNCAKKENNNRISQLGKEQAKKNMIGKIFYDFKVISMSDKRYNKEAYYICECIHCGKHHEILGRDLNRGHKKYCENPICRKDRVFSITGPYAHKDLTGQKFGKWTVLEYSHKNKHGEFYYLCKCDCGNKKQVAAKSLRNGSSQSCGCKKSSKGEDKIIEILNDLKYNYLYDTTELNCINPKTNAKLRFDFYIPDLNLCIEYDGEQHFKECNLCSDTLSDRQFRDNIKNKFCIDNGIKLIRIPYTDYDKLSVNYLEQLIKN